MKRSCLPLFIILWIGLSCSSPLDQAFGQSASTPIASSDVEVVTKEIQELKAQFDEIRARYETKLSELQERLARLEEVPVVPPPSPPPTPGRFQIPLGQRALLFDISFGADFVGNLSSLRGTERGNNGTFVGKANRGFPREIELTLQGAVDPFMRADCFMEIEEESEVGDGRVERRLVIDLDECYATLLTLPFGLQSKIGKFRPRFGRLNIHEHALPQVDRPNVLTNFFGEEHLSELGIALSYVTPMPFYQELEVGAYNGDNEGSFGRGSLRDPLVVASLKNFFEPTENTGFELGFSAATGPDTGRFRAYVAGMDLTYKWKPAAKLYRSFTLQSEFLYSHRKTVEEEESGGEIVVGRRRFDRYGFYVFGDYQLSRRWFVGARFDWSQFPDTRGETEWAYSPVLTFHLSEFSRFRVQYKRTERNFGKDADEVFFGVTFGLGPHRPHVF